jgi:hypothetical protein
MTGRLPRRQWRDMFDVPIGDRRNRVLEVRSFDGKTGLAYWTGSIWAKAPVRRVPRALGWKPDYQREPLTPEQFAAKLTRSQRRLLLCLNIGNFGRYEWANAPESALESCWALWRRGYVAPNDSGAPDATMAGSTLSVRLTDLGRELMVHVQAGRQ